jgi:pimeloyl-ACP methyl ester carboxylesterase
VTVPNPVDRSQRSRLAFVATGAAARWAAAVGTDLLELGRHPAIAATLEAGIRAEALCRAWRPTTVCHPPDPIHVHDGGTGPAVLFLNGWTASGLVWPHRLIAALERHHRVVRMDNRGSGWSRHAPRPYTIGDLADDARRAIESLGLDAPTVVGLSMGGMIAQELAMRWPDRVGRLVLLGTRPPSPEDTLPPATMTASMLASPPEGVPLRRFLYEGWATVTGPGFAAAHPEAVDEMASSIAYRPTPRFAALDQARAILAWSGPHRLRRLAAPATVVHGTEDPLVPVRNGMRLAQLIPGAEYVELPGVGHLVPYEAPDVVEQVVVGMVAEPQK